MNTFKGITDCKGLAEQLKGQAEGNSRQYYSAGNFGKGTYTAVRALNTKDKSRDEKNEIDKKASEHSWDFGKNIGAVQLTMMLNENARIIAYPAALALAKEFKKKYPSTYEVLHHEEIREGYSYSVEPAITAIIAFYGYNTLRVEKGCGADIDYYITTDRNAFMIDISKQMIRDEDGIEPY